MAKKGSFSKVYDKNGDYVDVEAARFDGTRTFQMQGDVSATQTWNGDSASALTLNTSIGAKKVTTDKINDKAVQTGQIDDGAVGLTQIATNAMNGTVQDNDSKLATHAAVKTYVDAQISGQGTYLGKHTVAEINAMVTDNLHNGDRVMTSDSGTINLGPGGVGFDVEAGEDLILYKSGSTVQWDSMDGNFKTKQTAVSDPTASGTGLTFIDSASQDENGEMTLSKKTVQDGTTSQKGVVQLAGSIGATVASENNKAATEKAVRDAINALDSNATSTDGTNVQVKVTEADGKISAVNVTTDNTENKNNKVTSVRAASSATDTAYPSEKAVATALNAKANANKVVAIADAVVSRMGTTGWFKVAERTYNQVTSTAGGTWAVTIISASKNITCHYTIDLNIRAQTSGTNAAVRIFSSSPLGLSASDNYDNFRCVLNGTSGSLTIELWYYAGGVHESMMLSELATGVYNGSNTKFGWTYYNISSSTAGSETAPTGNVVKDIDFVYAQKPVVNPTNNNLVAMDANGLVKDSGLTKSSVESAITSAGSAIQGVKVNNTTLTPDANKVVTVPLATTSADGAMSAADKTKLDGIAAGAEVNVQSDWNATSGDAFIPNKPIYRKYVDSATNIFKVCTVNANSGVATSGFRFIVRYTDGAILGDFVFRNGAKLFYNAANITTSTGQKVVFYKITNASDANAIDLYAYANAHTELRIDAVVNANSNLRIDFSGFGVSVSALPEGATEITPVWVANSASSSGTAPVKVDAYGALSAVPMDSTPTASSTNLMTSGDIKTALDAAVDSVDAINPYVGISDNGVKKAWAYLGKINRIDFAYNSWSTIGLVIRHSPGVTQNPTNDYFIEFSGNGTTLFKAKSALINAVASSSDLVTFYTKRDSTTDSWLFYAYCNNQKNWSSYAVYINRMTEKAHCEYDTTNVGYIDEAPEDVTAIPGYIDVNIASGVGKGSTSVPVYVNADGSVDACTVDSAPTASSANLVTSGGIKTALDEKAPLASPALTGTPTAPTAASGTNTTQIATTAFVNASIKLNRGYAYRGSNASSSVYKVVEIDMKPQNVTHTEFYVFSCGYSRFANTFATSQLALEATIGESATTVIFKNMVQQKNVTSLDFAFKVYVDRANAKLTIYAVAETSLYTCVEVSLEKAWSELSDLHENVTMFNRVSADLPENTVSETTLLSTYADGAKGSTSVPVYVDSYGEIKACTDDFVHDGDVAQTYSYARETPISGKGVTEKNLLKALELGSADNIDNLTSKMPVTTRGTRYLFWGNSDVLGTFPEQKKSFQLSVLVQHHVLMYQTQELWYTDIYNGYHYIRKRVDGTWQDWKIHWDEATSSYSSSGKQPVNGTAVASAISGKQDSLPTSGTASSTYAINISGRSSSATNWHGQISGVATSANTKRYVYIGRKKKSDYGCLIGILTVCSHTDSKDVYVIGSGWSNGNFGINATVQRISSGRTDSPIKICLYNHEVTVDGTTYSELWCYIPTSSGETDFIFRTLFNYSGKMTLATGIVNQAESAFTGTLTKCTNSDSRNIAYSPTNTAVGSNSVPVYVAADGAVTSCTDDFVHDGDVTSTYSSTGTAPVNGTAVAAAIATSLTDVEYVAAQSGGGGNLNKTKNGSTTSVLAFMTTAEAHSLWTNAKANAS